MVANINKTQEEILEEQKKRKEEREPVKEAKLKKDIESKLITCWDFYLKIKDKELNEDLVDDLYKKFMGVKKVNKKTPESQYGIFRKKLLIIKTNGRDENEEELRNIKLPKGDSLSKKHFFKQFFKEEEADKKALQYWLSIKTLYDK